MKWKKASLVPALICAGVVALICALEWLGETQPRLRILQRLEWITYDWRVREAARHSPTVATNLGFVAINDYSVDAVLNGTLPYTFGLLWPREVYARLVDELSAQGAEAVGFDVLFAELRPDHKPVKTVDGTISSDEFFAGSLRRGSNVILASEGELFPPDLFESNASSVANISALPERDGILRRVHAFADVRVLHPLLKEAAREFSWDVSGFRIETGKLLFPRRDSAAVDVVPLNSEGGFDAGRIELALGRSKTGSIVSRFEQAVRNERLWHLGLTLAAHELRLDLRHAVVDLEHGRIVLPTKNGEGPSRVIPVDHVGQFYIDWSLGLNDPRLKREAIEDLLGKYESRRAGQMADTTNDWKGKLVVVGSIAGGNNLRDLGATPLEQSTFLVSCYWNVANSLLLNRFIRPLHFPGKLIIIVVLGALAGICTWKMKTLGAVASVAGIAVAYVVAAVWLFNDSRIWLPIITPVAGSLLVTHISLVTYLVRVERRERRRTKDIFSKIVSPDIVRELLDLEKISLGGTRRTLTVFFADVRGFTEVTDMIQQRADALAQTYRFTADEAKKLFDEQSEEILNTINLHLGIAGDCIKKHGGTLDKYIGDCVMAFWGAPVPNPQHALHCVRAVIDMQRAIFDLNQKRREENVLREEENLRRSFKGELPLQSLDILTMGSGINTGMVTVGLMGSAAHLVNYTVFGREVNLASRLESASGRGRILIGEQTFREIQRDDPELAATCREQAPLTLKGFRDAVKAYEVPWRPPDVLPVDAGQSQTIVRDKNRREDCY